MTVDSSKLPERFELTEGDKQSGLWVRLEQYLNERIMALRAENDAALTPEQTANVRGRIAEAKSMLALAKEKPILK